MGKELNGKYLSIKSNQEIKINESINQHGESLISLIAIAPRGLTLVKSVSEGPKIYYKEKKQQLVWKKKCHRLLSNWFFEIELLSHLIKILKEN